MSQEHDSENSIWPYFTTRKLSLSFRVLFDILFPATASMPGANEFCMFFEPRRNGPRSVNVTFDEVYTLLEITKDSEKRKKLVEIYATHFNFLLLLPDQECELQRHGTKHTSRSFQARKSLIFLNTSVYYKFTISQIICSLDWNVHTPSSSPPAP